MNHDSDAGHGMAGVCLLGLGAASLGATIVAVFAVPAAGILLGGALSFLAGAFLLLVDAMHPGHHP